MATFENCETFSTYYFSYVRGYLTMRLCVIPFVHVIQSWYICIASLPYPWFTFDHVNLLSDSTTFLFGWVHFPFGFVEKTFEGCFSLYIIFNSYTFRSFTFFHSYIFCLYNFPSYTSFHSYTFHLYTFHSNTIHSHTFHV